MLHHYVPTADESIKRIMAWAEARNLIAGSNPQAQMLKLLEEIGELARAIAKDDKAGQADGIGDAIVVLTILAAQLDLKLQDCMDAAYEEIKDRRGKMIDGIFVKEADLPSAAEAA